MHHSVRLLVAEIYLPKMEIYLPKMEIYLPKMGDEFYTQSDLAGFPDPPMATSLSPQGAQLSRGPEV